MDFFRSFDFIIHNILLNSNAMPHTKVIVILPLPCMSSKSGASLTKIPAALFKTPQGIFLLLLHNHMNPALGRFYASHLDTGQGIVELFRNRSHLTHAACHTDFLTVVHNLSNR